MKFRSGCLYLVLVLLTAWTEDLQTGTFVVASPTGSPTFGQEVFPIATGFRAEIQEKLEVLPTALLYLFAGGFPEETLRFVPATRHEPALILSGSERCCLLMSLQE